jgi:hypothetical protein
VGRADLKRRGVEEDRAPALWGCCSRGRWRSPFPPMKIRSSRPSRPRSTPAMPGPPSGCVVRDVWPDAGELSEVVLVGGVVNGMFS